MEKVGQKVQFYICGHNFATEGRSELKVVSIDSAWRELSNEYQNSAEKLIFKYDTAC